MMFQKIFAVLLVLAGLSVADAATYGRVCNNRGYISEYMCGAYPSGPGWYLGQNGCWYLDTNLLCGSNGGYPNPYPPPYPGGSYERVVRCESYNYGYNECYLGYGVSQVTIVRQYSPQPCVAYQTFGTGYDRMWVSNGCRGDFLVRFTSPR